MNSEGNLDGPDHQTGFIVLLARAGREASRVAVLKRRILLAVTGLSPQVITETVYALAVERQPAWVPTEVTLVTTAEGAERARLTLLDRKSGWFRKLRREYRLPPIRFDGSSIRVLADAHGRPLSDIRTAEDNAAAADFLLEAIRQATEDPKSEVHVSIAGGRKMMGFFAGYALSLCGRPQDTLSHVLVDAPFEGHPSFFYPSREPRVIYTPPPESRPIDASQARVTLAEIPFVRLRTLVERNRRQPPEGFAGTVDAVQRELTPTVTVDLRAGVILAGWIEVRLKPAELAFYAMIARATASGERIASPSGEDPELARRFLKEYEETAAGSHDRSRTENALRHGMDGAYFQERLSRTDRQLREALGGVEALRYGIRKEGRRPRTVYSLYLEPEAIHFAEAGERI